MTTRLSEGCWWHFRVFLPPLPEGRREKLQGLWVEADAIPTHIARDTWSGGSNG